MTPTTTGIYSLRLPSGRVVRRKCIGMNGALYVVMPCEPPGWLIWPLGWLFSLALAALVPLDLVEGEWIFEQ